MKRVLMGFILVAAGIFAFANTAACTEACVWVTPSCRRCQDVGVYNGQTCQNTVGACGCFYVRNLCDPVSFAKSTSVAPAAEAATCTTLHHDGRRIVRRAGFRGTVELESEPGSPPRARPRPSTGWLDDLHGARVPIPLEVPAVSRRQTPIPIHRFPRNVAAAKTSSGELFPSSVGQSASSPPSW